jgi:AbrB family looped-hinge helix DNA binding protein
MKCSLLRSARQYLSRQAMVVLTTTKVGRSYRVTLPQEVRELLELREGDEIVFFTVRGQRGRVCLRKIS